MLTADASISISVNPERTSPQTYLANANCPPFLPKRGTNYLFTYLIHHNTPLQVKLTFSTMQILNPSLPFSFLWQRIHYISKLHIRRPPNHDLKRKIHFSGTSKYIAQNSSKHAVSSQKFILGERRLSPTPEPFPVGRKKPLLPTLHQGLGLGLLLGPSLLDLPLRPQNSGHVYATGHWTYNATGRMLQIVFSYGNMFIVLYIINIKMAICVYAFSWLRKTRTSGKTGHSGNTWSPRRLWTTW